MLSLQVRKKMEEGIGTKAQARGRPGRTRERRETHYERLCEPANRKLRRRRRETVEPTFGIIKEQMGFRRFSLRGREKADTEWRLVTFAFNLRKLSKNKQWQNWLKGNGTGPRLN